jgi:hypothetical protein
MAIIKEFYKTRQDGVNLFRTYSDEGKQIRKVGTDEVYDEAIDVENVPYIYEETDMPTEEVTDADYQEALREMGVKV